MASASDVPRKFDVVIDGTGFMCADLEEVKAQYGFTPTFVARSNTQGDYGDNFQDFWMTETQRDWTRGEQQRFYRPRQSDESASRYWVGEAVDRATPGQVSMRKSVASLSFSASVIASVGRGGGESLVYAASASNLYTVSVSGAVTDLGAHGAGTVIEPAQMAVDSRFYVYISGGTDVRKYDIGGASFSTFSATSANALAYLNNSLYGIDDAGSFGGGDLIRYDSSGNASTLYTWKMADGVEVGIRSMLTAYGSKLLIGKQAGDRGAELWLYDGTGTTRIAVFPPNFILGAVEVVNGVVYIGGAFIESTTAYRPAVFYYANGVYDVLWKSGSTHSTSTTMCPIAAYQGGLAIADEATGSFMFFDPITGGISTLGAYTAAGGIYPRLVAGSVTLLYTKNSTTGYLYSGANTTATTSTVTSSLYDFDSSLDKIFRGVKVEYNEGSDGDGGSIDIAYRVNDLDGNYTTLQTGVTSGTEYELSGVTGRSISIKVTLNKGTSTNGPVLKRLAVRAVPQQATFRRGTLVLNCCGRDGTHPVLHHDGTSESQDGLTLAQALQEAATSATPISITDQFGTLSAAVIEADGFQIRQVRPNEFIAVVPYREV